MPLGRTIRVAIIISSALFYVSTPQAAGQQERGTQAPQESESVVPADGQRPPPGDGSEPRRRRADPDAVPSRRGLIINTEAAFAGYTLFAPLNSTTTYLIDMKGKIAHTWSSEFVPGQAAYLLDDGTLLRCGRERGNRYFGGGGIGGRVQRIATDGEVLWEFVHADDTHCLHHDIEPLPSGNVLMIAWEKASSAEFVGELGLG